MSSAKSFREIRLSGENDMSKEELKERFDRELEISGETPENINVNFFGEGEDK